MRVYEAAAPFEPFVSVNGVRQPLDGAHVSARDRGLTLADGVFETMRIHRGRVFQQERHLARLQHAVAALRIPPVPDAGRWLEEAVASAGCQDAAVRLTVTRGVGAGGLLPPAEARPTVLVTVSALPLVPSATYEAGLRASVVSGRRNPRAATAGLKTLAYTDAIAGLLEARARGAEEALFLDTDDHCSEASASNLFFVVAGTLVTPPLSCGVLPGITRATIMQIAGTLRLDVAERECTVQELLTASEAFLTSSLRGIAPLVAIDGQSLGTGVPGPNTARLSALHAELVERECAP